MNNNNFSNSKHLKEYIIIVSGLPRSGTSMLMQMLEAGGIPIVTDKKRKPDIDNPVGYYEFEKVKTIGKSPNIDWMSDFQGKAIKIISWFLKDLSIKKKYKLLFIERDLYEVITSQNMMLINRGENVDNNKDSEMISLFKNHIKNVKKMVKNKSCFDTLYLKHSEIINDPINASKRISNFLGVCLDVKKMAGAVMVNLYRSKKED